MGMKLTGFIKFINSVKLEQIIKLKCKLYFIVLASVHIE